MPGVVWLKTTCPRCGGPWWHGVDEHDEAGRLQHDPLAADGVTDEARTHTGAFAEMLGACMDCRGAEEGGASVHLDSAGTVTSLVNVHRAPAQGRNEPCACGSGRKFKRCCGTRTPGATPASHADEAETDDPQGFKFTPRGFRAVVVTLLSADEEVDDAFARMSERQTGSGDSLLDLAKKVAARAREIAEEVGHVGDDVLDQAIREVAPRWS